MDGLSQIGLQGLSTAESQFNTAASQIARAPLAALNQGPPSDQVDLSTAAVALLESRNSFDANIKVLKTGDEMQQTLLNMIG
ncbi:MAG TPA: flagellar basal body rod C-terminal domain-containing protein [Bryobacteraceae bacterium]|nr:flagellar basal body rod C-terminal domain-containing protein [Bryobacteraceae bacterium]